MPDRPSLVLASGLAVALARAVGRGGPRLAASRRRPVVVLVVVVVDVLVERRRSSASRRRRRSSSDVVARRRTRRRRERPPRVLSATSPSFVSDPAGGRARRSRPPRPYGRAGGPCAGATGLEPATCGFGDRCATNCATPLCGRAPHRGAPGHGHTATGVTHPTARPVYGYRRRFSQPSPPRCALDAVTPVTARTQLGPGLGQHLLAAAGHGQVDLGQRRPRPTLLTTPATSTSAPSSSSGTTTGLVNRTPYSTTAPGSPAQASPPGRPAPW